MQLVMYIGNDFIASLPIDSKKITFPGYVGTQKRELLKNSQQALSYQSKEPDFWIVSLSTTIKNEVNRKEESK
jgi:hypothetical protein